MSGSTATIWEGPTVSIPAVNTNGNTYEEVQVAAAAQTVFTLTTFTYTPGTKTIFVYRKNDAGGGEMLRRGVDYTETSTSVITLAVGSTAGDLLFFVAYSIAQIDPPTTLNGLPAGGTTGQVLSKTSGSDYAASWVTLTALATLLDSARQSVASASTVDLSGAVSLATRNIQITGTTQIDGFQITNGQLWAVKFASALTLKNNANIVTQSGADIKVSPNDTCFIRATAANVIEVIGYSRASAGLQNPKWMDFRLTLSSGVPVPVADVATSATLYCTPYLGNKLALFDGTSWVVREASEFSIAIAALSPNRPYDVFCYDVAGTPTLELLVWTTTIARGTAITRQDGVLVKSGDATRRYLGTVVPTAAAALTDTARQRLVWNYYNRVTRSLLRQDATASWAYTLPAYRQANGSALNQVEYVAGVQEDNVALTLSAGVSNTAAGTATESGIGLDSTTVQAPVSARGRVITAAAGATHTAVANYNDLAQLGYHYLAWLEDSVAIGTTTWTGTPYSGLFGSCRA